MGKKICWDSQTTHSLLRLLNQHVKGSDGNLPRYEDYANIKDELCKTSRKKIENYHLYKKIVRLQNTYVSWCRLLKETNISWNHDWNTPTCSKFNWETYLMVNCNFFFNFYNIFADMLFISEKYGY